MLHLASINFVNSVWDACSAHLQESRLFRTVYIELLVGNVKGGEGGAVHLRSLRTIEGLSSSCGFSEALIEACENARSPSESRLIPALLHIATSSSDDLVQLSSVSAARNVAYAYAVSPLVREEMNNAATRYVHNSLMSLLETVRTDPRGGLTSIECSDRMLLEETLVELLWHLGTTQHRAQNSDFHETDARYVKKKSGIYAAHQCAPIDRYSTFLHHNKAARATMRSSFY